MMFSTMFPNMHRLKNPLTFTVSQHHATIHVRNERAAEVLAKKGVAQVAEFNVAGGADCLRPENVSEAVVDDV